MSSSVSTSMAGLISGRSRPASGLLAEPRLIGRSYRFSTDVLHLDGEAVRALSYWQQLLVHPGGHFDTYIDHFEQTSQAARDWLVKHLGS